MGITVHERGTVVIIQGPRVSSIGESRAFSNMGSDSINMTQYPENILAKEQGVAYVGDQSLQIMMQV